MPKSFHLLGAIGVVLLGVGPARVCQALEPTVTFRVAKGWVQFTLSKHDVKIDSAVINILSENGTVFAEGETGADGVGTFPMPRTATFIVTIKIGARTCDPIRVRRASDGAGVEPADVLLSFGLQPCCRPTWRYRAAASNEPSAAACAPSWRFAWFGAVVGSSLLGIGAALLILRRAGRACEATLPEATL